LAASKGQRQGQIHQRETPGVFELGNEMGGNGMRRFRKENERKGSLLANLSLLGEHQECRETAAGRSEFEKHDLSWGTCCKRGTRHRGEKGEFCKTRGGINPGTRFPPPFQFHRKKKGSKNAQNTTCPIRLRNVATSDQ